MIRAVIYARFSSDRQREESIEGQLRECREYAQANGIKVVGEYIDRALSASKETEKRLDFLRMIKDSNKRLFDVVLVWKLDRFARSRYDSAHYKAILKRNNVKVVSATERIGEGPEGIILESMLEGMAEYYSAELSEKIHRGQKENALKGKNNGGGTPLGYTLNKETKRLEIDPQKAPIIKEIFERYASGESIKDIKESLNSRGIKTSRGVPFNNSTFTSVLSNRKYMGEYRYQDVVIADGVPAIVSEEVFNLVHERVKKNKRTRAMSKAPEKYILTTKLFCGDCGCMMVGESGTSHQGTIHRYYKCVNTKRRKTCKRKAVKKQWIEDLVVSETMKILRDDEIMSRIADELISLQSQENYDLKLLKEQLKETKKGIDNMMNAIQAGIITTSTKERLETLEANKTDIEQRIIENQLENPVLTHEQLQHFFSKFKAIDTKNPRECEWLIDSFVNSVFVFDDRILLNFNYKYGARTITLDDVNSSDFNGLSSPKRKATDKVVFLFVRNLSSLSDKIKS